MIDVFVRKLRVVFEDVSLRNRLLFVLGALMLTRLLAAIPVPGVDAETLANFLNSNQFFGLLNVFSGGGFSTLSVVMLGVGPYITSSIVMQLMTILVPSLKEAYQEEGEAGRARFTQYSRYLTVPLAFIQSIGFILLLQQNNVMPHLTPLQLFVNIMVASTGSILLMWIGELISEFGVGNGISLLIFAGIVARIPRDISQSFFAYDPSQIPEYLLFVAAALLITAGVVFISEAERPVPVTYARRVRGSSVMGGTSTYLPLRVNQAGVIPIVFALSFLLFPQMTATFFAHSSIAMLALFSNKVLAIIANQWFYGSAYFVLVFVFTYFYTAITFEPHQVSKNLQRGGAYIPGIRPGAQTTEYLGNVVTHITLVGAVFLAVLAVLPIILRNITGITSLTIGGTALLIVVSVVLDVIKKIDAQTSIREY